MTDSKIHPLPGQKNESRAAVEALKRNLSDLKEHARLVAEIRRAGYDAYLEQGFSEDQALELCKTLQI